MLTRARKAEIIKDVSEKFARSQGVFVTSFKGFTVAESNEIRKLVREKGGEVRVIKNTLIRIASENTNFKAVNDYVEGPTALVFAYQDPVEIAKVLSGFIKNHPSLQIKGFVIQGKGYKPEYLEDLVKLPPREILLAQVLGTIQAPVSNFVGVLAAIIRKFLYALKAIEEKKAKGE
ncbi:50S ribosomal protein L10 [Thermodesulfobacterium sp. TA1]|uniref:50S ribosomal protein L10 n=1 Tax=Thermodesulfobacterium sp. TA1 TaxID=2234087 RepID=UPI001231CEC5|nr:50S ribosomal protein L10 [Thermodesulfobacterium sp. TA1]QER42522.1 50S ribosomal protein L10 [Thermodesulfobacterium sp. TA1]